MPKIINLFSILSLFLTSQIVSASEDLQHTCKKEIEPVKWEYCISRSKTSSNTDIMYYFHGLAGSVKNWIKSERAKKIQARWKETGKEAPIVISVSFGRQWTLATKNSSSKSGLYEVFTEYVMPKIENELVNNFSGNRLLMGFSMGAANATQLLMKLPHLFKKAVLACPAITSLYPRSSAWKIRKYLKRPGVQKSRVAYMLKSMRDIFPKNKDWENYTPLKKGYELLSEETPPTHISCGDKDSFGFYPDTKKFYDIAKSKNVNITWQSLKGGHCAYDATTLADFILD